MNKLFFESNTSKLLLINKFNLNLMNKKNKNLDE